MAPRPIQRALISVYDKTGIVDFARALVTEFGIEIISTGGTAAHLKEHGIPVTLVEDITGFPEMLDGRVKTLHPKIHAAILADRDNPEHMRQLAAQGIKPIDMVVVNLYPFEKTVADPKCTVEQAIEMIDIGGPCLLRAAAKNHKHVLAIHASKPEGLEVLLLSMRHGSIDHPKRTSEAMLAFSKTSAYDARLSNWLCRTHYPTRSPFFRHETWGLRDELRYGENPHQVAAVYSDTRSDGETNVLRADFDADESFDAPVMFRTDVSFNNIADADAALELCKELSRAFALRRAGPVGVKRDIDPGRQISVFIKHTNPCGVGYSSDSVESFRRAYLGDCNAAMGGVFACSSRVTVELAAQVMGAYGRWGRDAGASGFFVEVWVAPAFDDDAVATIRNEKAWGKRVRLFAVGELADLPAEVELQYRKITGGMLVQTRDLVGLNEDQWKVVTKRPPSESEISDLRLAWLVAKHTKSNAISICKDGMLIGNGAGQMSRVMSCRIATWLANENGHADKLKGAAAASDAFFPFADGPKLLMDAGVTAIIQPGGSKRDEEVIKACDEHGVAMIFTGTRHFRH